MQSIQLIIPPFSFMVGDARVDVLEILKSRFVDGSEIYHASIRIVYKGIASRVFTLYVRNGDELVNKATVEVNKIKWMEYNYGLNEVKRLIS